MAKAGYVGNQPVRESQAESYPGAWTGQEQYQEARADNWPKSIYEVERSVRINSADNAYFSRTPSATGNTRTWTWSGWIKRSALSAGNKTVFMATTDNYVNHYTRFIFTNNNIYINHSSGLGGARQSVAVYRDTAAWMHVVIALDTTQATAASRLRFYVNGQEITAYSGADPGLNAEWWVNSSSATHFIGTAAGQEGFDGYLANIHLIDGLALTPSAFGVTDPETNEWMPKKYTNSYGYGVNGFWLKFADNSAATASAIGKDSSPNGNNWTPSGISVAAGAGNDSLVDTPTSYGIDTSVGGEVRGNYCTFNPLETYSTSFVTLSNGNLWARSTQSLSSPGGTIGTPSTGKWYWEISLAAVAGGTTPVVGFKTIGTSTPDYPGYQATSWGYRSSGLKQNNGIGSSPATSYGASWSTSDVIGVGIDADAGTATFYKNGISQGIAFTGLTGSFTPHVGGLGSGDDMTFALNAGQRPFAYAAPSGFKALCDTNFPAPSITRPNLFVDTVLYTGNGSAFPRSIAANGRPHLLWIKARNLVVNHRIVDIVRGALNYLESNTAIAQVNSVSDVTGLDGNGFSVRDGAAVNQNTATYAAWHWMSSSSLETNTQGTITSSHRATPSVGLSIVSYTGNSIDGATVGHGLGKKPALVIVKNVSSAQNWAVHGDVLGPNGRLVLNSSNPDTGTASSVAVTSSVFTLTNEPNNNGSGNSHIAYCFAPIDNYSAFGRYTGNASTDGPFIYLGFRPAIVIIKSIGNFEDWVMIDDKRLGYNIDNNALFSNLASIESSSDFIDITSNGFKVRANSGPVNNTSIQYLYAAWAAFPLQYARAR